MTLKRNLETPNLVPVAGLAVALARAPGSACLVCGSKLTLQVLRGPLDLLHCNHCGSEVPTRIREGDRQVELFRTENRELRIMCAIAHCGLQLYYDDGELQDAREYPWIDWKRDPVGEIESKLSERLMRRMRKESEKRGISPNAKAQPDAQNL